MQGKKGTKKERPATMTIRLKNDYIRKYFNEIVDTRNSNKENETISQNDLLNEIVENYVKRNYTKVTGKAMEKETK